MRCDQIVLSAGCYRLLLVVLLLSICGCSRQARHDVLTFFFTGVPPLEEVATPAGQAGIVPAGSAQQQSSQAAEKKAQAPPRQQYYSHPVWIDGQCDACHQGKNLFVFQTPRTGGASGQRVFFSGGGMPGPLKGTADQLCSGCHSDKTAQRAISDHLWLHNPIAKGTCLACHDPHQSKHSGVLRKPAGEICQTCHREADLAALPLHRSDGRPCLDCHNPHMGKDRMLLRQEYQEQKQPVSVKTQGR